MLIQVIIAKEERSVSSTRIFFFSIPECTCILLNKKAVNFSLTENLLPLQDEETI